MEPRIQFTGSDNQWIERAAKGDLDAFNELVLRYQDIVYNHALLLLNDPDHADDVTQESFIKAFQAMNTFRGGSFRSWLLKIATHSAYDMMRRSKRHPTQPLNPMDKDGEEAESIAWLADPNASVQDTVEQKDLQKDIHNVLNELSDVYRNVIVLIDIHELDYAEAAQALSIPIGTVKSRLARARSQMKDKLKSLGAFTTITTSRDICTAV